MSIQGSHALHGREPDRDGATQTVILRLLAANFSSADAPGVKRRLAGQTQRGRITGEVIEIGSDVSYLKVGDLLSIPVNAAVTPANGADPMQRVAKRATKVERGGLTPRQLASTQHYIAAHLAEDIALQTLADLVGLSPHHFCRAFKVSTGSPPHRWQLEARVRRAESLMSETRDTIADIAVVCGFFDQSHFTRVFQRIHGISPGQWRRAVAP